MPILTEQEVRGRAQQAVREDQRVRKSYSVRNTREILREAVASLSEQRTYDMFLSHSIRDSELILGIKAILEDLRYAVYVDWIEDPHLDRDNVTPSTADVLRRRMQRSKSLLYVTTQNSDNSKWMPWECGYFDGLRDKVAIVPVKGYSTDAFAGVEYLGLYPYCVKEKNTAGAEKLWVHKDAKTYVSFDAWVGTDRSALEWKKV